MNNISTFTGLLFYYITFLYEGKKERKEKMMFKAEKQRERDSYVVNYVSRSDRTSWFSLAFEYPPLSLCKLGKLTKKLALFLKSHLHLKRGCLGEEGGSFLKRLRDRRRRRRRIRKGG